MGARITNEYCPYLFEYRFALARSSLPRAVNRIFQILTYSGTAKIYRRYVHHRPETTILYQVIQEYWPEFQAELASQGTRSRRL